MRETFLAGLRLIQRDGRLPSTPLESLAFAPFIGQEMIKRNQQECPETALFRGNRVEPLLMQQPREELLRQILRAVMVMSPAAHVSVEGVPISPAKLLHGHLSGWR